jgi:hypothetical protein
VARAPFQRHGFARGWERIFVYLPNLCVIPCLVREFLTVEGSTSARLSQTVGIDGEAELGDVQNLVTQQNLEMVVFRHP